MLLLVLLFGRKGLISLVLDSGDDDDVDGKFKTFRSWLLKSRDGMLAFKPIRAKSSSSVRLEETATTTGRKDIFVGLLPITPRFSDKALDKTWSFEMARKATSRFLIR